MGGIKFDDFRNLGDWKRCKEIRKEIWLLCKTFPQEEKYHLSDQMIRASRSSTVCIAEGYGRFHYHETIQLANLTIHQFDNLTKYWR